MVPKELVSPAMPMPVEIRKTSSLSDDPASTKYSTSKPQVRSFLSPSLSFGSTDSGGSGFFSLGDSNIAERARRIRKDRSNSTNSGKKDINAGSNSSGGDKRIVSKDVSKDTSPTDVKEVFQHLAHKLKSSSTTLSTAPLSTTSLARRESEVSETTTVDILDTSLESIPNHRRSSEYQQETQKKISNHRPLPTPELQEHELQEDDDEVIMAREAALRATSSHSSNSSAKKKNPLKKFFQPIKQEAEHARQEIRKSFQRSSQKGREALLNPIKQEAEHAREGIRRSFQRSSQKGREALINVVLSLSGEDDESMPDNDNQIANTAPTIPQSAVEEAIRISESSSTACEAPTTASDEPKSMAASAGSTVEKPSMARRRSIRTGKDELSKTNRHLREEAASSSNAKSTPLTTTEKLYMAKRRKLRNKPEKLTGSSIERAKAQRNRLLMKKMMVEETSDELDVIQRYLGVCEKGKCLRHPNQRVCGRVVPKHRFALVHSCRICQSEQMAGGGKRQRRSMAPVIADLKTMQRDRRQWREKTKLMHHGRDYSSDEDSFASGMSSSISADGMMSFCATSMEFNSCDTGSCDDGDGEHQLAESQITIDFDDEEWKDEVSARVAQVRAWDLKAALKCSPIYAKYFRMQNYGIPMDAIKQNCAMDGWDPRILDLDPNQPLEDQLLFNKTLTDEEKEDMLYSANHSTDDSDDEPGDIHEIVERIHEAYCKRKEVLDNHLLEENKKKEAKKWIGQDWGSLLRKPKERTPVVSPTTEKESDAAKELRLLEEEEKAELQRQLEEEKEQAAAAVAIPAPPASPLKSASNHSDLMSPSTRSHSTLGPLPTFFTEVDFGDNSIDEQDIETKDDDDDDDDECDWPDLGGSSTTLTTNQEYDGSISDLSATIALTEVIVSPSRTKRNRKHKKSSKTGKNATSSPRKSTPRKKPKKKLSLSSDDSGSIDAPSPRKSKPRSPRKSKSEKKPRSIDFDKTIRKPKSGKKIRRYSSQQESLSINLETPIRKPKSKKKLRRSSESSSTNNMDSEILKRKVAEKPGSSLSSDDSLSTDFDTNYSNSKSKKSLRFAESELSTSMAAGPLSSRRKNFRKDELSASSHAIMTRDDSSGQKKSKDVRGGELSISCHPRINSFDDMKMDVYPPPFFNDALLSSRAKRTNTSSGTRQGQPVERLARSNDLRETTVMGMEPERTNLISTDRDIVMTSLITQVRTLQSVMDEMQRESRSVANGEKSQDDANALRGELATCKKILSEKDTILSSLVAQVQSLQTMLKEKEKVISSQAVQIERAQLQMASKDKAIEELQQELKDLEGYESSVMSSPSFADASVQSEQDHGKSKPNQTQVKDLNDDDSDLEDESSVFSSSSFAIASPSEQLQQQKSEQNEAESQHDSSQWWFSNDAQESASESHIVSPRESKIYQRSSKAKQLPDPESALPTECETPKPRLVRQIPFRKASLCLPSESRSTYQSRKKKSKNGRGDDLSMSCHPRINEDRKGSKSSKRRPSVDITMVDKNSKGKNSKRKKKRVKSKKKRERKTKEKEENFDPKVLRAKFKQAINKTIVISKIMKQDEHANDVAKELTADRKSFRRSTSSSTLIDWVAPAEWNQYFSDEDEEAEKKFENEILESISEPTMQCPPTPTPDDPTPRFSPVTDIKPATSILRVPSDTLTRSKATKSVQWKSDDMLHHKISIHKISNELKNDLWFSNQDLKIFAMDKYMEDNPDEFEVIESEDEDDEYTYTSCSSCSYIEEEITEHEDEQPLSLEPFMSVSSRSL